MPTVNRLRVAAVRSASTCLFTATAAPSSTWPVGNGHPVAIDVNVLLAAHARTTTERLVAVKREVVDERARADDQGTNAMYLTRRRRASSSSS